MLLNHLLVWVNVELVVIGNQNNQELINNVFLELMYGSWFLFRGFKFSKKALSTHCKGFVVNI